MVKTNINKKDIAKDLYLKGGCTQEEIALKVGTTRQTISRWSREGNWEEQRSFTPKEADTVVKITSAVKKLQNDAGITDIVNVGIKFTNWLRAIDIQKAKEYNELWDLFIKDQLQ